MSGASLGPLLRLLLHVDTVFQRSANNSIECPDMSNSSSHAQPLLK